MEGAASINTITLALYKYKFKFDYNAVKKNDSRWITVG